MRYLYILLALFFATDAYAQRGAFPSHDGAPITKHIEMDFQSPIRAQSDGTRNNIDIKPNSILVGHIGTNAVDTDELVADSVTLLKLDACSGANEYVEYQNGTAVCVPSSWPVNTPIDTDGDGNPDFVFLRGDYDGSAAVDTDDIQAAIDALTDTGPKHVLIDGGLYLAPTSGLVEEVGGDMLNCDSLVSLPSDITLEGAGARGRTIIQGIGWNLGDDVSFSVVGNDACAASASGNSNIVIRNLVIDGGLPTESFSSTALGAQSNTSRMGIRLQQCTNCIIENNEILATVNTGIYVQSPVDTVVRWNIVHDVGCWWDSDDAVCTSAIQNRTVANNSVNTQILSNVITRVGGVAIDIQGTSGQAGRALDLVVFGNSIQDSTLYCFQTGGYLGIRIESNTCVNTGGFNTTSATTVGGYKSGANLVFSGNTMRNTTGIGVNLRKHHRDAVVIGNVVDTTTSHCMGVASLALRADISGLFRNCGDDGISWQDGDVFANGAVLHDFTIDGWGQVETGGVGILQFSGCDGQIIRNGIIKGSGKAGGGDRLGVGYRAANGKIFRNCLLENLYFDVSPKFFVGEFLHDDTPPACSATENDGAWLIISNAFNSTGIFTDGAGSFRNMLKCNGTAWVDWAYALPASSIQIGFHPTTGKADNNEFKNITIVNHTGKNDGTTTIDAILFEAGAWVNTYIQDIRIINAGTRQADGGTDDGIRMGSATDTGTVIVNVTCNGIAGTCDAF